MARAMLFQSGLPKYLWAEAINHSVWIRNHAITRSIPGKMTPFELATGDKPDMSNVHEWGCKVWVKLLDVEKLEPRAKEGRFVGFDDESKAIRVYWPNPGSTAPTSFPTSTGPFPARSNTTNDLNEVRTSIFERRQRARKPAGLSTSQT